MLGFNFINSLCRAEVEKTLKVGVQPYKSVERNWGNILNILNTA